MLRERERTLVIFFWFVFLAIVVFLTYKIVGSVFTKYNLECYLLHGHVCTTLIAYDSINS